MADAVFDEEVHLQYQSKAFDFKTRPIVKMGNLALKFDTRRPEKNVAEEFEAKNNINNSTKIFPLYSQMPLQSHPVQKLDALQRKLYHLDSKLCLGRIKMGQVRDSIQKDWKDLEKGEKIFRESFISFNEFVQKNHDKRIRAEIQLEYDRAMTKKRQKDINQITQKIKKIQMAISMMDKISRNLRPSTVFMEKVVEEYQEFSCINDVIERYAALDDGKNVLLAKYKNYMQYLEDSKNQLMKLIEEKTFVIMGLNNQIANLQARYEHANIKALESEGLVTQIKNNAVKQLEEIDTVKNSIWNVYVHMASSKKHPIKIKKDNVEEQMMYINRTLTELNKVNKLIKKKATKVK